jgi:hypothetical protein
VDAERVGRQGVHWAGKVKDDDVGDRRQLGGGERGVVPKARRATHRMGRLYSGFRAVKGGQVETLKELGSKRKVEEDKEKMKERKKGEVTDSRKLSCAPKPRAEVKAECMKAHPCLN